MPPKGAVMPNEASVYTKNAQKLSDRQFDEDGDSKRANRGLIAKAKALIVKDSGGHVVWRMDELEELFKSKDAPVSVNPSLWRHERLNTIAGLFEVADGVYQIRGFDLANLTLIKSQSGYIAVDPLSCVETASAAIAFAEKHLGAIKIAAIVVTHSHWDHFGGAAALSSQADIDDKRVALVVPDRFEEELTGENIFVGAAMNRRSAYQFGTSLNAGAKGCVGSGLGKGAGIGVSAPLRSNTVVSSKIEEMTIDGVRFVFLLTPDAEAPSEMCFYLPDLKVLCAAEIVTRHLHNILPFRGAQARSALAWSKHIDDLLSLFGDKAEALLLTHHFPEWGVRNIARLLADQRDLYRYIHDQTVRLINKGYTAGEIAEALELPDSLGRQRYCGGYYGTLNHNVKAVYQRYLGWFDCNPANLNPLPPEESGRLFTEMFGGIDAALKKARTFYESGQYRFAAQILNHAVFGCPQNEEAKTLLADVYEQLGYQSESASWRNLYLTGALELRDGAKNRGGFSTLSREIIAFMPTELLLDYLATKLDPKKAENISVVLNLTIDGESWVLNVSNSVLSARSGVSASARESRSLTRAELNEIALGLSAPQYPELDAILSLLDRGESGAFNIARP
jgi:alkyl sulfatase BDS1-like metallo-beta-lactamase superfamily hydrolase